MRIFIPAVLTATLMLGACGEESVTRPATFTPATRPPGLSGRDLIGADARTLLRQFGKPRLDVRDPTARKLQFANDRCILDTFLYAPAENREPVVTYAEARTPQGAKFDANACAKLLQTEK